MARSLVQATFGFSMSVGMVLGTTLGASAHSVDVTEDVAGTWHIEPDHQPKAGESAQVWIALTRKGGDLLPFEQTSCSLSVYDMPRSPSDAPILRPVLQAISAEQYPSIPGADVVFPDTGLYQVELDCQPSPGAPEFAPFKMQYDVTVASGSARTSVPSPVPNTVPNTVPNPASNPALSPSPAASSPAVDPAASPTSPSTVPIEVPLPGAANSGSASETSNPPAPASALWVQLVGLGLGTIAALFLLGLLGRLFRGKG